MKKASFLLLIGLLLSACGSASPTMASIDTPVQASTALPQPTAVPQATLVEQATPLEQTTLVPQAPPALDGAAILENQCAQCHSSSRIKQAPRSRDQWDQTVNRMIGKGAVLTDAEKAALIDYLAQNYGK